jgi:hypothetical protein
LAWATASSAAIRAAALSQQRRLQRSDIVGQVITGSRHAGIES